MNIETTENPESNRTQETDRDPRSIRDVISLAWDIRMLWIFLLGCYSGYPWAVWSSCQVLWLAQVDISKGTIGLFSLLGVGYGINWLWAPIVDHVRLPILHKIGHRKSWLILCLTVMCLATFCVSFFVFFEPASENFDPVPALILLSAFLLVIAWSSATLDITTAAYRINIIKPTETRLVGTAAAMEVAGWWVGYGLPAGFAFWLAEIAGWNVAYGWLATIFLVGVFIVFAIGEPERVVRKPIRRFMELLDRTHFGAFLEFFKRNGTALALYVLLFVFSFKLGEAFLGKMSIVFYDNIGFSGKQIGVISKWIGTLITVSGSLLAGLFVARFKLLPTLIISGIGMAATNLMFVWIAVDVSQSGVPSGTLFVWTTVLDNFSGAFASLAFVSFITHYTSRIHSATQYTALSSLGTLGRTSLAALSGFAVEGLGDNWVLFFILTSVAIVPALMLLWPIHRKMKKQVPSSE